MRRAFTMLATMLVLASLGPAAPASACDPVDATAFVAATDDGFVFVTRQSAVRLSASGQVQGRRGLAAEADTLVLLADGRTLLHLVPLGDAMHCRAARMRFELVDTGTDAPPRVIGVFPARSDGVEVRAIATRADGTTTVRLARYSMEDDSYSYEDVEVRAETRRARAVRVSAPEDEEPPPLTGAATAAALRVAASDEEDALHVSDGSGAVRVTVRLASRVADWALSADGRHLAIATYSVVNEDYGTGLDARLEIVDLTRGVRVASQGEGTAITAVRGMVRVTCAERVNDPGSALNVRSAPSPRAPVIATLPHGSSVTVAESRERWRRLSAPREGWVWASNLARTCEAAPP